MSTRKGATLNTEFLKQKIKDSFRTVDDFAREVNVSRNAIYKWYETSIPQNRLMTVVDALKLTPDDIDELMGIPKVQVMFRKRGLREVDTEIEKKAESLAHSFFKLDKNNYRPTNELLSGISDQRMEKLVVYIRSILELKADEPAILSPMITQLKKHGLELYYLPFKLLGLSGTRNENREVAFTAIYGDRAIIFLDAQRTVDESTFDLCHELGEFVIGFDSDESGDEKERKCNQIARELIYPEKLIEAETERIAVLTNPLKHSYNEIGLIFADYFRKFSWVPKGLCIALQELGHLKKEGDEARKLFYHQKRFAQKPISDLYFRNFLPDAFEKLIEFFDVDILENIDLFQPFLRLKDAATFGNLSTRRLAEILSIDHGDADELVKHWETQIEDGEEGFIANGSK